MRCISTIEELFCQSLQSIVLVSFELQKHVLVIIWKNTYSLLVLYIASCMVLGIIISSFGQRIAEHFVYFNRMKTKFKTDPNDMPLKFHEIR